MDGTRSSVNGRLTASLKHDCVRIGEALERKIKTGFGLRSYPGSGGWHCAEDDGTVRAVSGHSRGTHFMAATWGGGIEEIVCNLHLDWT